MKVLFLLLIMAGSVTALGRSQSQNFSKHKGFMVFLNWYFMEPPPFLVKKHFRNTMTKGPWKEFEGSYGAFDKVKIGVCRGKIVQVAASTNKMPGGIKAFLDTWLNPLIKEKLSSHQDMPLRSEMKLVDQRHKSFCQRYATQSRTLSKSHM